MGTTTFNFSEEMEMTEKSDDGGSVSEFESEPEDTDDEEIDEESQPTL